MGDPCERKNVTTKPKNLHDDSAGYRILKEGEAEILIHRNDVFYNKAQVVNRDLSIAVLRTYVDKRNEEHKVRRCEEVAAKIASADGRLERTSDHEVSPLNEEKIKGHEDRQALSNIKQGDDSDATARGNREVKEAKPLKVLEALAASGLRALRYAREVEGLGSVIAIDNDKVAFEACKQNIKLNGSFACSKVEPELADARVYMLTRPKEFDVVDLDPYGSPSIFLDSAVQSVVDGGMLMCTATDMAVLCGNDGDVCYSKYGSYPSKGKYCHEMALRILLACIENHANRYKRYIVPVLSVSVDFYIRVFVRIYTSANAMKSAPLKLSYVYQCTGCDSFHLQPLARTVSKHNSVRYAPAYGPVVPQECSDCGKIFNLAGPIWSASIHDQEWISSILSNVVSLKDRYPAYERISAVLTAISEELLDVPLYVSLHSLSATLKCESPSAVMFRSAVMNAGYRMSGTHANPLGLKSDAPMSVIWDIMRCWVKLHPVKSRPSDQPGSVILAKEPTIQANFARLKCSNGGKDKKKARFLPNPESHWGPKPRAGRQIKSKNASLFLGPDRVNRLKVLDNPDEPETGVDPKEKRRFLSSIKEYTTSAEA
ncbi:probable tRNA (guanine(26)-N(2))-dimethyltransferase 2 isoform X1 [Nymphaea colorata]|uniref:probable tRNA (guanine(26)-N(2))-dimethyltransferase 2 isoform X1 n=1 Tax=Nymphaea colorata TaxID=210225 RepID=UPI00129E9998|nr:probable tRNA (guanine(26)-N(2))-dimethyltransferase 2 isoform X1 [Nymphaea colorata]